MPAALSPYTRDPAGLILDTVQEFRGEAGSPFLAQGNCMRNWTHQLVCVLLFGAVWLEQGGLELGGVAWGEVSNLFVGTYTRGTESRGIYVYRFDDVTGELRRVAVTEGIENPSFLAVHPNKKWLYSSDEIDQFDGEPTGAVSAFAIDPEYGTLTLLNQQAAGGTSPCHLTVDPAGGMCSSSATVAARLPYCPSTKRGD